MRGIIHTKQMLFICQMFIMMIVNWFHLDFNSVKVLCIVQHIKKINIRYLNFDVASVMFG